MKERLGAVWCGEYTFLHPFWPAFLHLGFSEPFSRLSIQAALVTNSLATSWKVKVNIVTSLRRLLPNVHKHQDGASPAAWLNLLNMVKMGGHWLEVSQLLESWVSAASQHLYLPLLTWYPTSSACWSNIVTTSKYLHTIHAPTEDHGATLQEASHLARYLETFKW